MIETLRLKIVGYNGKNLDMAQELYKWYNCKESAFLNSRFLSFEEFQKVSSKWSNGYGLNFFAYLKNDPSIAVAYLRICNGACTCITNPEYRNMGYMSEMLIKVIEYCDIITLSAHIHKENMASQRCIEKCGFVPQQNLNTKIPYIQYIYNKK